MRSGIAIGIASDLRWHRLALAQDWMAPDATPKTELLWPGAVPGAVGTEDVDKPTLTIYLPAKGPGHRRGHGHLSGRRLSRPRMDHEGHRGRALADITRHRGLRARSTGLGPRYHHPAMLQDVLRAIRVVRSRADEFNIKPDRVGIMGFSAGGHLASSAATLFDAPEAKVADGLDAVSSRPDFAVLGYPVILMGQGGAHRGSQDNLLGENAPADLGRAHVHRAAGHREDAADVHLPDQRGHRRASRERGEVLSGAAGRPACRRSCTSTRRDRHGVGLDPQDREVSTWPDRLLGWLRVNGIIP